MQKRATGEELFVVEEREQGMLSSATSGLDVLLRNHLLPAK
jgi:hypothetical protein